MKQFLTSISPALISKLLELPEGAEVVDVRLSDRPYPGCVLVHVVGEGLEFGDDELIPHGKAIFKSEVDSEGRPYMPEFLRWEFTPHKSGCVQVTSEFETTPDGMVVTEHEVPVRGGPFYRWPAGLFDADKWSVYRFRSMPCTPAGDPVKSFSSIEEADMEVLRLNTEFFL